jgi:hypothetical protein
MGEGYLSLIKVLKKRGDSSGVEAVLYEAIDRLPDDLWAAREYAEFSQGSGDNEEIARRWLMVADRFPDCEIAYKRGADALTELGRTDEAAELRAEWARRTAASTTNP